MVIEVARDSNMSMGGKSLLRSLQNSRTPKLDLFVRETIQNSLDAGHDGPVDVRFETGDLNPDIAAHFDGIENKLRQAYETRPRYLAVRDYGTEGLSGPVRVEDIRNGKRGNLRKLVYEIGKAQDAAGAGGSWGLGKTISYRMGIGLVIYYSRFWDRKTGQYVSRLAATMVEDETRKERLLPSPADGSPSRGIAWWGVRDTRSATPGPTIPIEDKREINAFLQDFGIKPYTGTQTGTTILIPYIDEKALLRETHPATDPDRSSDGRSTSWSSNVADYLRIAVQRWYAPRLENKATFDRRILKASVNGKPITRTAMAPFFRLVQTLYKVGRGAKISSFEDAAINTVPIRILAHTLKGNEAGVVAFAEVSSEDLGITPPDNNPDPLTHIGASSSDDARMDTPVILYARSPGMVVSYETSGDWIPRVQRQRPDRCIVGVFVPKSDARLWENDMNLEEYLRQGEIADHMSWQDGLINGKQQTIVKRISQNVRKHIEKAFQAAPPLQDAPQRDYGLGRAVGNALMPPTGFGAWDARHGGLLSGAGGTGGKGVKPTPGGKAGSGRGGKKATIRMTGDPVWEGTQITVPVEISLGTQNKASVEVRVETENGSKAAKDWENDVGTTCPVRLNDVKIIRTHLDTAHRPSRKPGPACAPQVTMAERHTEGGTFCGFDLTVPGAEQLPVVVSAEITYTADRAEGRIVSKSAGSDDREGRNN